MMRPIGGDVLNQVNLSSLRQLQARQSFAPKAGSPKTASQAAQQIQAPPPVRPAVTTTVPRLNLPYQDIQAVAEQAGFVGLSQNDIQRAFVSGNPLLVNTFV